METGFYHPVGETDSELAFCWILEQLRQRYPEKPEQMNEVFSFIASLADELRQLGVFNMLLSNGEYVMAYCSNNLHWITRRAPFGKARLQDADVIVDFQTETSPDDVATVVATQPLTCNESWSKMVPGEFAVFHFGELCLKRVQAA